MQINVNWMLLNILFSWCCGFVDGDRQVVQLLPLLLLFIAAEVWLILHGHDVHISILACSDKSLVTGPNDCTCGLQLLSAHQCM